MALTIDNCLVPQGSGTNLMYGGCCCSKSCTLTNQTGSAISLDTIFATFQNAQFSLNLEVYSYQGAPITTFPFFVPPNESIQVLVDYCAATTGIIDTLMIYTEQNGGELELYFFDFEAIDLSTSVDITSIDFGTVNLNTINPFQFVINNPTSCCYNYGLNSNCADFTINPLPTRKLCFEDFESIEVTWQPTTTGPFTCTLFIDSDCQTFEIPITGLAVEAPAPPPGGNNVSGKRTVVDCPTGDCGLFNPQPGFAQTTKNAINQISRATRPKGGPGRGTNFR